MSKLVHWSHFVYTRAGPYRCKITIAVGCFGVLYVSVSSRDFCKSVKIKKIFFYFLFSKKSFEILKSFLENLSFKKNIEISLRGCDLSNIFIYVGGTGFTPTCILKPRPHDGVVPGDGHTFAELVI